MYISMDMKPYLYFYDVKLLPAFFAGLLLLLSVLPEVFEQKSQEFIKNHQNK